MIAVNVADFGNLDEALKRFSSLYEKSGLKREIQSRQFHEKASVTRRRKHYMAVRREKKRMAKERFFDKSTKKF